MTTPARPPFGRTTYARLLRQGDRFYWWKQVFEVVDSPELDPEYNRVGVPVAQGKAVMKFSYNGRVRLKRRVVI